MSKNEGSSFLFNFISPIYGLFYNAQKTQYKSSLEKIKEVLDIMKYKNIVDVGCGTGALCSVLNETGLSVTGVDPAEKMLNIGAKKAENKDIEFINACACRELPFPDNFFDLSVASYVAHGLKADERKVLYLEMSRISKHYVILYDYNDKRAFFTNVIEWAEGGDYFNFIKNVNTELNEHFKSVQEIKLDKQASWYVCESY